MGQGFVSEVSEASSGGDWLYVQPASLNCRSAPSTSSAIIEGLRLGELVQTTTTENSWARLDRPTPCWVRAMYLGSDKPSPPPEPVQRYSPPPAIQSFSSAGGGSVYYRNCAAARAAGAAPVRIGEPGYSRRLDRDGDGVGCE